MSEDNRHSKQNDRGKVSRDRSERDRARDGHRDREERNVGYRDRADRTHRSNRERSERDRSPTEVKRESNHAHKENKRSRSPSNPGVLILGLPNTTDSLNPERDTKRVKLEEGFVSTAQATKTILEGVAFITHSHQQRKERR